MKDFDDFYAGIFEDESGNQMFIHSICHRDREIAEMLYREYRTPETAGELYKTGYLNHFIRPFEFTEIRIPSESGIIRAYIIEGQFLEIARQKSSNLSLAIH